MTRDYLQFFKRSSSGVTECGDFLTKVKEKTDSTNGKRNSKDPMSMSFGRGAMANLSTVSINHRWISFKALSKDFLSPPWQGGCQTKGAQYIRFLKSLPPLAGCLDVTLKRICSAPCTFHKWQNLSTDKILAVKSANVNCFSSNFNPSCGLAPSNMKGNFPETEATSAGT